MRTLRERVQRPQWSNQRYKEVDGAPHFAEGSSRSRPQVQPKGRRASLFRLWGCERANYLGAI